MRSSLQLLEGGANEDLDGPADKAALSENCQ